MQKRVLSGMRPTGKLHLGHWVGALSNWVELQKTYECFFMLADYHALMSEYKNPGKLKDFILDNLADWITWGVDADKSVVFIQSDVAEHLELFMVLSALTPLGWLYRCPTFKDQISQLQAKDINTYSFLGYPVLQAADIMLYQADCVPVGDDQVPHLELSREIARRFNNIAKENVLKEPQPLLTEFPRLLGLDGRKMSKSYDNCIYLSEEEDSIRKKVMGMFTDPERIKLSQPGRPEVCNVYSYFKAFFPEESEDTANECRSAKRGCTGCKKILGELLIEFISAKRKEKNKLLKDRSYLEGILKQGRYKAKEAALFVTRKVKSIFSLSLGYEDQA